VLITAGGLWLDKKTWRDNYREFTGDDSSIYGKCHVEMEFWCARYGSDVRVLKHFG